MPSIFSLKRTALQRSIISVCTVSSLAVLLFVLMAGTPQPVLDDATLTQKALEEAQRSGLQGKPVAQRGLQMSYGEWLPFVNSRLGTDAAQFGYDSETPVFVLALHGAIKDVTPGQRPMGQNGPDHFTGMTIVLDARSGDVLERHFYRPGTPLPIPVP